MSNYLNNIVARSMNVAEVVQPRLPQLFEPANSFVAERPDTALQVEVQSSWPTTANEISETPARHSAHAEAPPPASYLEPPRHLSQPNPFHSEEPRQVSTSTPPPIPIPAIDAETESLPRLNVNDEGAVTFDRRSATQPAPLATQSRRIIQQPTPDSAPSATVRPSSTRVSAPARDARSRTTAMLPPPASHSLLSPTAPVSQVEQQPPTVKITIGRIDVRAVMPPAQPAATSRGRAKPALSLEGYLKQREEGKR